MRYATIKENKAFSFIYRRGKSFVSPVLVTYVYKNKMGTNRYGITTGKKIGNAVKRSRARRAIRAAYDSLYPEIKNGYDFIFVARGKTPFVKSQIIEKAMRKQLLEADVLIAGSKNEKSA